jgi:hypothetical protein
MIRLVHSYSVGSKIPCFIWIWKFILLLETIHNWTLSWVNSIQFTPMEPSSHYYYCWPLDPQPLQGTRHWSPITRTQIIRTIFPWGFLGKRLYTFLGSIHLLPTMSWPSLETWQIPNLKVPEAMSIGLNTEASYSYCLLLRFKRDSFKSTPFMVQRSGTRSTSAILNVWDSSVPTVTRLSTLQPRNWGLLPCRAKDFSYLQCPDMLWRPFSIVSNGNLWLFPCE